MSVRIVTILALSALLTPAHAGLTPMDREEIADITSRIERGRVLEAQEMLHARLGRIPAGAPGTRYERILPFLELARLTEDHELETTALAVLREDGLALAKRAHGAGDSDRARVLGAAVTCLKTAVADAEVLASRGWCQFELGEIAAARADLAAALAEDPDNAETRGALARAQWRMGQRRPAIVTVVEGLRRRPSRTDADLLATMLRVAKAHGRAERAQALATRWVAALSDDATASPLRSLLAEIQLERNDLDGALDTFGRVVAADRPWLLGGVVRTARAQAAAGKAEQVLAAIHRLPMERDRMPAPLLKLSGDIAMGRKDAPVGLRHYAAAVTGGEIEARELAEHARAQGTPLEPGAMAALLSGHEVAYNAQGTDPGYIVNPFQAGGAFFSEMAITDPEEPEMGRTLARAWRENAARRAANALAIVKSSELAHDKAVDLAVTQSTPVPARQKMVRAFLSGDIATTKSELDAFSLVSWQVLRPGVVGALRVLPPGSGATNVEPLSQPASAPPALDAVGQALAALNNPDATEQARLAKIMEVAGQRTPETERLGDPVAIDLDGNGQIDLTRRESQDGAATFDLDGWGNARHVQWLVTGRDGWLCEDLDGDGQISSGHEMFGTAGGYTDGFEKLAARDRDGDGVLRGDELAGLSVWRERVNPGRVDPGELTSIEAAGVESITVPRVGLRSTAVVNGTVRVCAEVWPEAIQSRVADASNGDLDLEGI